MKHRISSGGIVVVNSQVLLVRHSLAGSYDFWVAPGGGLIEKEDVLDAAVREVKEETNLEVNAVKPVYLEQFHQPGIMHIKTWVLCDYVSGDISTAAEEAIRENITEGAFLSEKEVLSIGAPVFPEILRGGFWSDLNDGFPDFKYLGCRKMEYY